MAARNALPALRGTDWFSVQGIKHLWTIRTSHVERNNLTIRTFLRRFTRLTVGFSKKLENLQAAVAMHMAHYNYVWRLREKGKSGKKLPTPAMQAGIVDRLWTFEDLFEAVTQAHRERKFNEKYKRLAEKLRN